MSHLFNPDDIDVPRGHLIAGREVAGGGDSIEVCRPSDGVKHASIPAADAAMVDRAVQAARAAFPAWKGMAPRERGRLMRRWAELVEANLEDLASVEALVSTRNVAEARVADVPGAAEWLRFYGEYADKLEGTITATSEERLSLVLREPYGVVGVITPWNFPLFLAIWKMAPAIAAGNTVVLKPSELTPFSIQRVAQLAAEAGIPPGVVNIVHGTGTGAGASLVRHPDVDFVAFTGSTSVGARIMSDAALSSIKPVSLELGGKHPQLVFADCGDLDPVATHIAWGITRNAGQICSAGSRLVVEKSIEQPLLERIANLMRKLVPGPTWSGESTLAPVISAKQLARIEQLVNATIEEGAELVCGGERIDSGGGWYYSPTILRGVRQNMTGFREEIFGPALTVQTFNSFDEGLEQAAHPMYGLSAAVFTRDINKALNAAKALRAGTVWVNRWGLTREMMTSPFGGYRQSGFGKDSGREGIEKYLHSKTVWIDHSEQAELAQGGKR